MATDYDALANQLFALSTKAFQEARAANEARYQQIIAGFDDLIGKVPGTFAAALSAGREAIDRRRVQELASGDQNIVSRGLYNTTALDQSRRRTQLSAALQAIELASNYGQRQADLESSLRAQKLQAMAARNDIYPNPTLYSQIGWQLGQAAGQSQFQGRTGGVTGGGGGISGSIGGGGASSGSSGSPFLSSPKEPAGYAGSTSAVGTGSYGMSESDATKQAAAKVLKNFDATVKTPPYSGEVVQGGVWGPDGFATSENEHLRYLTSENEHLSYGSEDVSGMVDASQIERLPPVIERLPPVDNLPTYDSGPELTQPVMERLPAVSPSEPSATSLPSRSSLYQQMLEAQGTSRYAELSRMYYSGQYVA